MFNKIKLAARMGIAGLIFVQAIIFCPLVTLARADYVTLHFMQEDIRVVLHTLSVLSGTNIIIDDSTAKESPSITINLDNVPFETALELIAETKGLSYHRVDNTIMFERADISDSVIIPMQYTNAEEIKKAVTSASEGMKLKVDVDVPSNSLVVSGSSLGVRRLKNILIDLDKPIQQIELEAKVVAISKSATKDLGVKWEWDQFPKDPSFNSSSESSTTTTGTSTSSSSSTTVTRSTSLSNETPGIIKVGRYEFYFSGTLSAMVSKGDAKILSRPKVTTVNGKEAKIMVGDRVPVQTETVSNGTTSTSVTYYDTGIKLTYTPIIGADGQITAKVHTEVSSATLVSDIKQYKITTREADTNVRVRDGETIVIGGLIGSTSSESMQKVPFLGDLPLVGGLFRNTSKTGDESEVVIFLTPRIIK